jgi:hypothetical protein
VCSKRHCSGLQVMNPPLSSHHVSITYRNKDKQIMNMTDKLCSFLIFFFAARKMPQKRLQCRENKRNLPPIKCVVNSVQMPNVYFPMLIPNIKMNRPVEVKIVEYLPRPSFPACLSIPKRFIKCSSASYSSFTWPASPRKVSPLNSRH